MRGRLSEDKREREGGVRGGGVWGGAEHKC